MLWSVIFFLYVFISCFINVRLILLFDLIDVICVKCLKIWCWFLIVIFIFVLVIFIMVCCWLIVRFMLILLFLGVYFKVLLIKLLKIEWVWLGVILVVYNKWLLFWKLNCKFFCVNSGVKFCVSLVKKCVNEYGEIVYIVVFGCLFNCSNWLISLSNCWLLCLIFVRCVCDCVFWCCCCNWLIGVRIKFRGVFSLWLMLFKNWFFNLFNVIFFCLFCLVSLCL